MEDEMGLDISVKVQVVQLDKATNKEKETVI